MKRFRQIDIVIGLLFSTAIGMVFVAAMRVGMPPTGLQGGLELVRRLRF